MKPAELQREVAKAKIRPAYLLAGEEPLFRDDALAAIRAAVLDGAADDFNFDRLSGRSTTGERLRDVAQTLPMMAARRLVVLSEPAEGRGNASKELCDALVEVVAKLGEQTETVLVVVTAAKADKRSAWLKAFKDPAALVDCAAPGSKGVISFIGSEAKAQGLTLEAGVAELLAERIGPQLLLLRHELTKVSLLAGPGNPVERSHVEASTNHIAEESVWDLMDAIGSGRVANSLVLLGRLEGTGAAAPAILGSLASHFRKLARLRSGATIAAPPFVVRKLESQARRFTLPRLVGCLKAIHETDTALKGAGALPPEAALERLVIGLAS